MSKKTEKTILVTGATGNQGGAVLHHLLEGKFSLRVLTRNPEKPQARALIGHGVDVIGGDLNEPASITRALEDVNAVYSVQDWTGGPEVEIRQGTNLIDAANRSGIDHFVYSSVASADQNTGIPHFDSKFRIEEHLRNSGLPYTIFRPVFFMENWLQNKEQIEGGTLALPLTPETRFQMIAVEDIGAIVAKSFEHPRHWQGRILDIAGDDLSMTDIAAAFSTALGREVHYLQVPWDEFEKQAGHEMAVMFRWFQDVNYHVDIDNVRADLPSLTKFDRWLNTAWRAALDERSKAVQA